MSDFSKQSSETFTVEQGFYIGMAFFSQLWFLIQRIVYQGQDDMCFTFFCTIAVDSEYCAEWIEAVRRLTGVPKEKQRTLYLTLPQIFQCTLEYCKIFNKKYNNALIYTVNLLESMEKEPGKYREEWNVWKESIEYMKEFQMNGHDFNWEAHPAWSYD